MRFAERRLASAALPFVVLLSMGTGNASAALPSEADSSHARELFEQGVKLATEERWAEAEHAFAESELLVPRASTAYDRALALYRLGRLRETCVELDRFTEWSDPQKDAEDRVAAARLRQSAEAAIATLSVTLAPATAALEVDHEPWAGGGPRLTLALDPGEHVLHARAEGFRDGERTVRLAAGARQELDLGLVRESRPTEDPAPPPPARGRSPGTLPVVLGVAGGVSLAAALVTGVVAGNLDGKIDRQCTSADICPASLKDDQSRMWALATASDVTLFAGLGLVGAGISIYLLSPGDKEGENAARARLTVGPASAAFSGAF